MAYTGKFLNPIRQSLSFVFHRCSSSVSRTETLNGKFEVARAWMKQLEPSIQNRFSNIQCKLNMHTQSFRNLYLSGSMAGVPFVIGFIAFPTQVAYAMDGQDILVDDTDFLGSSDGGRDPPIVWMFFRKLLLPAFFFLTLLLNLDNPIILITKAFMFLISTKPNPLTVYVFLEKFMHLEGTYEIIEGVERVLSSIHASTALLVLSKVKGQSLTLLGALGGWWALPLSQRAYSEFWDTVLY